VATLDGRCLLTPVVRRCRNPACPLSRHPYRPEAEGAVALPHGEFGRDLIAPVGTRRFAEHRSVPEIHQALRQRGSGLAERTVTNPIPRDAEPVAVRLAERPRLQQRLAAQARVVLAIDGLPPDVGHAVRWVLRDCLSGEGLLARSLLSGREDDPVPLIAEGRRQLPVPLAGVASDGPSSLRPAVATALPGVPHQLCHVH
jgi:hypothetical protein